MSLKTAFQLALSTSILAVAAGVPATAGAATLFDQIDPTPPESTGSQDFETAFDVVDTLAADDFIVPAGQVWKLDSAFLDGFKVGSTTPAAYHVALYRNAGTLPGEEIFNATVSMGPGATYPDVSLPLSNAPVLPAGTWWLSAQARLDGVNPADPQQWFWSESDSGSGSTAVWRNPSDAYGTGCTSFTPRPECPLVPTGGTTPAPHPAPGQSFRLEGSSAGAALAATAAKAGKKGKLELTVNAPNTGTLTATSLALKPATAEVTAPGEVKLTLKPSSKSKRKLKQGKKVKATVALSMPPLFDGTAFSATVKKKLKL
jgi:hypothetical protein